MEGWNELQAPLLETNPLAWVYFLSFIIFGGLIIVNLFVAVVLDNMQAVRAEEEATTLAASIKHDNPGAQARFELQEVQEQLARLQRLL